MTVGVENLTKIVAAGGAVAGAAVKIMADGKPSLDDLGHLLGAFGELKALVGLSLPGVAQEAMDLDPTEAKALVDAFFTAFQG